MDETPTSKPQSLKAAFAQLQAEPAAPSMTSKDKQARTVARLVLVQALYQMELSGIGVEAVIREFSDFRLDGDLDPDIADTQLGTADEAFFAEGLRKVVADQAVIDKQIVRRLAANWRLDRLDATLRAILRAGAWELTHRPDVGREVSINEYVEIAKAFYGDTEAKFVNAALDGIASDLR